MGSSVLAPVAELSLRAEKSEVRFASSWLEEVSLEHGVPPEHIGRLNTCLNEVLANIITHAGGDAGSVQIDLQFDVRHRPDTSEATVTVADSGAPFDPLSFPLKPVPRSLAEAEPGGLGLPMIRHNSDSLDYHYRDGQNCLKFSARWTDAQ
jgi:anti-sigma regulatory factor (Ser/Thr protein kinase)